MNGWTVLAMALGAGLGTLYFLRLVADEIGRMSIRLAALERKERRALELKREQQAAAARRDAA